MTFEPAATRKAARTESGGWNEQQDARSGADRVDAFSSLSFGRIDLELHPLGHDSADEAAHAVRLPARRLHEGVQGGASRLLHQSQNCFGLAALARDLAP